MKRKIKEDDLDYLFSDYKDYFPNFLDEKLKEKVLNNIIEPLKEQFRKEEIYEETLPEIKEEIKRYTIQSIVPTGEMIGVLCAQSIGERQTQLTLNSFHQAGLAVNTVLSGVPRFLEILNATKDPKVSINSFEMYDKSYKTISEIRKRIGSELVHILWKDLIVSDTLYLKGEKEEEPWYESFELFYSNEFRYHNCCFSYKLNKEKMYQYNISLSTIRNIMENEFEYLYVVFSPLHIGQVDFFIDLDEIEKSKETEIDLKEKKEFYIELFLQEILRPKILEISISGIPKIKDYYIQKNDQTKQFYIDTEGSNMVELLKLDFIDKSSVKTNHMWEVYQIMGIEGTRKFLLEELKNIVSSDGTFINECHLTILIDLMTFNGTIQSISRYGVKKEQNSVLTRSSFEESLEHFSKAAFFSEKEMIRSVSASIMCGKRSNIGSGSLSLSMDWEKLV